MLKKAGSFTLVGLLLGALWGPALARSQSEPDAFTLYQLNMRQGPGANFNIITTLLPNQGIVFEGRNADMSWLLGHTEDGAFRGWVASLYLSYRAGFSATRLPLSDELVAYQAPIVAAEEATLAGEAVQSAGVAPDLEALPIVPTISATARTIFQRGQALGNHQNVVTKVGECNSMSWAFLAPFNTGEYDLGPYGHLQGAISAATFVNPSTATGAGYTVATVLDSAWANPGLCSGLSPLECEYQHSRPSVAFIMLGMHDVHFLDAPSYEQALRQIVEISIEQGVIPVLTTFPIWQSGDVRTAQRFAFNSIQVRLAREYDIPLMNFWRAAEGVQHHGVGEDHVHITERGDNWTAFTGDETQWGITMWNLVALQTLDQIQQSAMQ